MKRNRNTWINLICFLGGSFVCYILLQFSFFKIKLELDIPTILLSLITASIGLYIANTIQKKVNKNQNQYSYLKDKLDSLWTSFNNFSKTFVYDSKIEASAISSFSKEIIHPIDFIKIIFASFEINNECVLNLEKSFESLEKLLSELKPKENIVYFEQSKEQIDKKIAEINQCFSSILKTIQDL
ncbi:MAG: hypothetical protein WCJ95_12815 [Mariniphaga sp.]